MSLAAVFVGGTDDHLALGVTLAPLAPLQQLINFYYNKYFFALGSALLLNVYVLHILIH